VLFALLQYFGPIGMSAFDSGVSITVQLTLGSFVEIEVQLVINDHPKVWLDGFGEPVRNREGTITTKLRDILFRICSK